MNSNPTPQPTPRRRKATTNAATVSAARKLLGAEHNSARLGDWNASTVMLAVIAVQLRRIADAMDSES